MIIYGGNLLYPPQGGLIMRVAGKWLRFLNYQRLLFAFLDWYNQTLRFSCSNIVNQTFQLSRFGRETHGLSSHLTVSRFNLQISRDTQDQQIVNEFTINFSREIRWKWNLLLHGFIVTSLLSLQWKCWQNIVSIHFFKLINSFDRKLINFLLSISC